MAPGSGGERGAENVRRAALHRHLFLDHVDRWTGSRRGTEFAPWRPCRSLVGSPVGSPVDSPVDSLVVRRAGGARVSSREPGGT